MKVRLRIQKGVVTNAIEIPEHCLSTEYRFPLHRELSVKIISSVQDMITAQTTHNKCLIFRWNRKDYWGGSKEPIMDCVDFY